MIIIYLSINLSKYTAFVKKKKELINLAIVLMMIIYLSIALSQYNASDDKKDKKELIIDLAIILALSQYYRILMSNPAYHTI